MSLLWILNEDEICLVRRAVAVKFIIKYDIINCFKYVHAPRDMTEMCTQYITINNVYKLFRNTICLYCLLYTSDAADE